MSMMDKYGRDVRESARVKDSEQERVLSMKSIHKDYLTDSIKRRGEQFRKGVDVFVGNYIFAPDMLMDIGGIYGSCDIRLDQKFKIILIEPTSHDEVRVFGCMDTQVTPFFRFREMYDAFIINKPEALMNIGIGRNMMHYLDISIFIPSRDLRDHRFAVVATRDIFKGVI